MQQHNNLYYLFLEDKAAHPMDPAAAARIRKNLEEIFKNIKPP